MTEEAMLFRRVQEGCWEAFDVLFHTYAEQLFFYAMGFVNNREEARDIVQGTFITLWEQRGKIQCTGAIYPYLLRLVKNACLNYQVHEKVKERYLLEKRMTEEEGEEVQADEEEEFEVQYARLRKVVDGLPEKCREIFILGCVDGLSYKEVSEKMGVSVNTVKTQIKLAYRKLKLELGGQNFVWEWTAGGVLFILMQK